MGDAIAQQVMLVLGPIKRQNRYQQSRYRPSVGNNEVKPKTPQTLVQIAARSFTNENNDNTGIHSQVNQLPKTLYYDVIDFLNRQYTGLWPSQKLWRVVADRNKMFSNYLSAKVVVSWNWAKLTPDQIFMLKYFPWRDMPTERTDLGLKPHSTVFFQHPSKVYVNDYLITIENEICAACIKRALDESKCIKDGMVLKISQSDARRRYARFKYQTGFLTNLCHDTLWCVVCKIVPLFSLVKKKRK